MKYKYRCTECGSLTNNIYSTQSLNERVYFPSAFNKGLCLECAKDIVRLNYKRANNKAKFFKDELDSLNSGEIPITVKESDVEYTSFNRFYAKPVTVLYLNNEDDDLYVKVNSFKYDHNASDGNKYQLEYVLVKDYNEATFFSYDYDAMEGYLIGIIEEIIYEKEGNSVCSTCIGLYVEE